VSGSAREDNLPAVLSGALCYFAYGSNMHPERMSARVPSAAALGVARLPGYRLAFHKRSTDGSGKGDIVPAAAEVWGVLYRIAAAELPLLDAAEGPGYKRVRLRPELRGPGVGHDAFAYRARPEFIAPELLPLDWYMVYVREGARYHGLPAAYQAWLDSLDIWAGRRR
jgi:gamma-glutamylcyclotransferase (GGCT)/AIG2-like uncharacterized protein YtfP